MRERVQRFQICEYPDCKSPFVHRKTDEDHIVHCDSCGRTFREKRKEDKAQVIEDWR